MIGTFAINEFFFWLNLLYFIAAVFLSNYIPGNLLLRKVKLDSFSHLILSIVTGLVLWGYQGYIFGYLRFRFGSYIYLAVCLLVWLLLLRTKLKFPKLTIIKEQIIIALLILLGTFVQLLQIWYNGIVIPQGLYFCCGIDTVYHLALTRELVNQFPPLEPGTFNTVVVNYHYFSNMIAAEWVRVFRLPLTATYFQYSTILLSLLIGLSAVTFCRTLKLSNTYIYWLLFFLYFSGSATFIIILLTRHVVDFNATFLHDATSLWFSPPRVYAIVILLSALSIFHLWLKSKRLYLGIVSGILFGCLISVKVYFGLYILAGFFVLNLYYLATKNFKALIPSIITLLLSSLLYFPINKESGGLFFTGMWRFENFIVFPALGLSHWELARVIYIEHKNWIRLIQYEIYFVLLYFVAAFGTLLLAFVQYSRSLQLLRKDYHYFLMGGIFLSLSAGLFFIQDTGGANTAQFIITVLQILPIYAALAAAFWLHKIKNKMIGLILILSLVFLTIPRVTYDTYTRINQLAQLSNFTLSNDEQEALRILRKSPDGIILTPLYDCLYISLLTDKQVFACDDAKVLIDHKVKNGKERIAFTQKIYKNIHSSSIINSLKAQHIKYIYIRKNSPNENARYALPVVFTNSVITILEVQF